MKLTLDANQTEALYNILLDAKGVHGINQDDIQQLQDKIVEETPVLELIDIHCCRFLKKNANQAEANTLIVSIDVYRELLGKAVDSSGDLVRKLETMNTVAGDLEVIMSPNLKPNKIIIAKA